MRKKDYILNAVSVIMIFFSILFLFNFITIKNFDTYLYFRCFSVALTILMWYKKDSVKKFKYLYNIVLLLLLVYSVIIFYSFISSIISCVFKEEYVLDWSVYGLHILLIELFSLFLVYLFDFKKKKSTLNHILVLLVSIILIGLVFRYNYDIDFVHNYLNYKRYELYNSYTYIVQYYFYFNIICFCLVMYYFLNREN